MRSQTSTLDSGTIPEPLGEENDSLNDQNTEHSNHQIDRLFNIERYGSLDTAIRVAKQAPNLLKFCLKSQSRKKIQATNNKYAS